MSDEKENIPSFDNDLNDEYLKLLQKTYNVEMPEENGVENNIINEVPESDTQTQNEQETASGDNLTEISEKTNGEFDDISSNSQKEKNPFKRIAVWYKNLPKKKKIIVSIIAVILCIAIILGSITVSFVIKKFKLMGDDVNYSDDVIYDDEEFEEISGEVGAAGFNDALKAWATTGNSNIMSSKNVINVLLIGADSRYGTNSGNTDAMILVSLNRKTKQIKLISFFRDSYLYIENNGNGCFNKLNAAYSVGGAPCLLKTIENNYKIDIDNFVMVNFESFKAIIDAMDGVNVDVQKYEADYIYKRDKIEMPVGENVKLSGKQALIFCRIRGCDADADVSRTRRQRQVINAIMDRVKTASLSDMNKYIDTVLPYVYTGYGKTEIITLGMKAITGGWAKYDRTQLQMPFSEARDSGYAGNAWIWVVDYQLAAHQLQTEIYGSSNITLEDGRRTLIDVYKGRGATGTSGSGSSATVQATSSNHEEVTKANEIQTTVSGTETKVSQTEKITEKITNCDESTENVTENTTSSNEPVSETETQVTEPVTEVSTEQPTEALTEKPTEKITEKQTEKPIETTGE